MPLRRLTKEDPDGPSPPASACRRAFTRVVFPAQRSPTSTTLAMRQGTTGTRAALPMAAMVLASPQLRAMAYLDRECREDNATSHK